MFLFSLFTLAFSVWFLLTLIFSSPHSFSFFPFTLRLFNTLNHTYHLDYHIYHLNSFAKLSFI